jgi:ABC-2 type transport system permease protein
VIFGKALAFMRRDFLVESSYKISFALEIFKSLIPTLTFFFIGKLVPHNAAIVGKYGGNYFSFAIVGVAFSQYLVLSLGAFSETIRRQQMAGCLEAMLSTRTGSATVILLSPLYSFLVKTSHIILIFSFGALFLGVDLSHLNIASTLLTVVLTLVSFSSLGILSATVILLWKKGDPITWFVGTFGSLLGGAFFPKEVLPNWLRWISAWNPVTYALDALRLSVFKGDSPLGIWRQLLVLGLTGAVLLPVSVWLFSQAVEKSRRDGSLLHY